MSVSIREGTQDQYFAGLNFSDVSQPNKHINIHFYISRLRNPPSFYKNVNIDRPGEVVEVRGGESRLRLVFLFQLWLINPIQSEVNIPPIFPPIFP